MEQKGQTEEELKNLIQELSSTNFFPDKAQLTRKEKRAFMRKLRGKTKYGY